MVRAQDVCVRSLTPAMRQYVDLKQKHAPALLFFQMGDFFELFFEDAATASKELGLALTKRGKAGDEAIPMCGIPMHASQMYLSKLLGRGYSVAVCVQTEAAEAKEGTGPLSRAVTQVLTPGTAIEDFLHTSPQNQFLMVTAPLKTGCGIALLDTSTGDVFTENLQAKDLKASQLLTWNPREILVPFEAFEESFMTPLKEMYKGRLSTWPAARFKNPSLELQALYGTLSSQTIILSEAEARAVCVAADYARASLGKLPKLLRPKPVSQQDWMVLDAFTRKNLELTNSSTADSKTSLLAIMDKTQTPMGSRLLTQRLLAPSNHLPTIQKRLDIVAVFLSQPATMGTLREHLKGAPDLQRCLNRLFLGKESPRDLGAVRDSLKRFSAITKDLSNLNDSFSKALLSKAETLLTATENLAQQLEAVLMETPPPTFLSGHVIKPGADDQLDSLRQTKTRARQTLEQLEARYQQAYALPSLRIRFNNLIGFFAEVPRRFQQNVPEGFQLRQGMAQTGRYKTPELEEIQHAIEEAEGKAEAHEKKLFLMYLEQVLLEEGALLDISHWLARVDFYTCLAHIAKENNYVKPEITHEKCLTITQGRHPVIEQLCASKTASGQSGFTPNDCQLDEATSFNLMTAPNMAGKSTYLRQNALIVLMAHMGSFVPAASAKIGLTDAIFSRLGAHDDLAGGHSTFMIEMMETAHILRHASDKSLVILDEVGRGTSTCDGLAIAKACVSYLAEKIGCRTFFATHYFELTDLENQLTVLKNYTLGVHQENGHITFLHHVVPGHAESSYGIEVAKLAGLPEEVLNNARHYKQIDTKTSVKVQPLLRGLQTPCNLVHLPEGIDMDALSPKDAWLLLEKLLHQKDAA